MSMTPMTRRRSECRCIPPNRWFTLDAEQRDELLSLLDFLRRGKHSALQRLDAALGLRAHALPKIRYPLEKLRTRLSTRRPD